MTKTTPARPHVEAIRLREPEGERVSELLRLIRRLGADEQQLLLKIATRLCAARDFYRTRDPGN